MILIIIALVCAFLFPVFIIKAITIKDGQTPYIILSSISFVILNGVILFMIKHIIDNYLPWQQHRLSKIIMATL